ncbi:MAG: dTMP kinase [Desulfatitalea sp.]|nr:dTMP kinase [Desulfatitalea sp.]NNK01316.1 dTMP kinase [Desulfatitalea sp.]
MFITLEGIEGSGKTTQVEKIVSFFQTRGHECVSTREPGGTAVGAQIRTILLNPQNHEMDPGTELLLYVADRVQHLLTVIRPHLSAGRVVVCDRFFDATLVYQGYARGVDKHLIQRLHHLMCSDARPDVTFLFDLDPAQSLARAWRQIDSGGRAHGETRFEKEKLDFHQRVRDGYLDIAKSDPKRFRIVDASQDARTVGRTLEAQLSLLIHDTRPDR